MKVKTTPKTSGLSTFADWQFTPERAAVFHREQTAVIADVHLGYEWARGSAGDCVVEHSLQETTARLQALFDRTPLTRLIVAGDLLESARPCPYVARDLRQLKAWLENRGVSLLVLEGNHDVRHSLSVDLPLPAGAPLRATCDVGGWTIGHGHRPLAGAKIISAHHHPVFCFRGHRAPCFLVGADRIVLPAFSSDAAGCDVVSAAVPREWLAGTLRCLVSTGDEVLDFGPITALRRRLRYSAR
jgi:uncharacterized protein